VVGLVVVAAAVACLEVEAVVVAAAVASLEVEAVASRRSRVA